MNQDLSQLKKLRDQIIGIEMHISTIQSDLSAVDRDIQYLEDLELVLIENVYILKSTGIIAIITEYKRSVQELATVGKNLEHYRKLKIKFTRDSEKHGKMRDDAIFEFEILKKQLGGRKVILLFDPSKRKK